MQIESRRPTRVNGQLYLEFSRRRYNQLKAESTQMREAEIRDKIIREWQDLPKDEKSKYGKKSESKASLGVETTPNKKDIALQIAKTNQKTTGAKESPAIQPSESDEDHENESSDNNKYPKAPRRIRRLGSPEDYMTFFRFYYERTRRDHPNWSPNQVTIIIKLLWKKRKQEIPGAKRSVRLYAGSKKRAARRLSGRQVFGKEKKALGHSNSEIVRMWKHLPIECRKEWEQKGDPSLRRNYASHEKATVLLPVNKESDASEGGNGLNFLNHK